MRKDIELTVEVTLNSCDTIVNNQADACEWENNARQVTVAKT